jgi:folate-binding protein YgfZ
MILDYKNHAANNLSVLQFTGTDSISFLQGQISNDINALSASWQFSGYCNPKGRLLALLQVWKNEDVVYASIDSSLVDATIKRLRMYVMRSKVIIDEIKQARFTGLTGLENKSERFSVTINDSIHTLHYGDRALRIDLQPSDHTSLEQVDDWQGWAVAKIAAGEPTIDADNVEMFVPQMVNLDLLDGINFKKGCYTGQEIVARMHYLGKLKQRMFVCQVDGSAHSGEKILAAEKNAGTIVSAFDGSALAVIRRELLDNSLKTESGAKVIPLAQQPYSIPE